MYPFTVTPREKLEERERPRFFRKNEQDIKLLIRIICWATVQLSRISAKTSARSMSAAPSWSTFFHEINRKM